MYDVCRELDLLIIEDDPYWQLDYADLDKVRTTSTVSFLVFATCVL